MEKLAVINGVDVELEVANDQVTTTSLDIAAVFNKRHDNIIAKIETFPKDSFTDLNFKASKYIDSTGRILPCYKITRDGFSLLVMGFTGEKAYKWKVEFIKVFNEMEKRLRNIEYEKHDKLAFRQSLGYKSQLKQQKLKYENEIKALKYDLEQSKNNFKDKLRSLLKLIEKDRIKYIPHIKETLESPQAILKDKDDFIFIKNIDNQTYFTSIGKDYETHLTIISNSPKKQNNIRNKIKNAEVVYYNNARALPTSRASSETNQVSFSNENSTQAKPKKNLMEDIKENIEAKEVEKKNKKSVKQRLDEKIQNDKKASEDILKRYDDFLKENKDYNLDFLGNLDVVTREFILNAKKKTYKGKKADIPDLMRFRIEKELNIQALKEFGKNYAEYYHDGKGALQKLLIEKQGQVAGAFHRKDLGDIDLVWGDGNFGLSHIVNRREEDFIKQGLNKIEAKNKALNFIKEIENIINNGNVKKGNNRAFIEVKNSRVMVALDYKGKDKKWIITAYNFY